MQLCLKIKQKIINKGGESLKNNIMGSILMDNSFGFVPRIKVSGSSMNPILLDGDSISIIQSNEYSIGDIVVFEYDKNDYIVHRVVYKDKEKLICKGDNSFRLECIENKNIIGKVLHVNRNGKIIIPQAIINKYIDMSYRLGLLAVEYNYKLKHVISSDLYKQYYYEYLRRK